MVLYHLYVIFIECHFLLHLGCQFTIILVEIFTFCFIIQDSIFIHAYRFDCFIFDIRWTWWILVDFTSHVFVIKDFEYLLYFSTNISLLFTISMCLQLRRMCSAFWVNILQLYPINGLHSIVHQI